MLLELLVHHGESKLGKALAAAARLTNIQYQTEWILWTSLWSDERIGSPRAYSHEDRTPEHRE